MNLTSKQLMVVQPGKPLLFTDKRTATDFVVVRADDYEQLRDVKLTRRQLIERARKFRESHSNGFREDELADHLGLKGLREAQPFGYAARLPKYLDDKPTECWLLIDEFLNAEECEPPKKARLKWAHDIRELNKAWLKDARNSQRPGTKGGYLWAYCERIKSGDKARFKSKD